MEITKVLVLAFCHGNHGGSKEKEAIGHFQSWLFLIENDVFALMKSNFTIDLTQRSSKSQAQKLPDICDYMFYQIQNNGARLKKSNAMLIVNLDGWL